jgi:hypothetical protein
MSGVAVFVAYLLPMLLGAALIWCISGRPHGALAWLRTCGEGWVLGLVMISLMMMLPGLVPARAFSVLALPVLAVAVLLVLVAIRRRGHQPAAVPVRPEEWPVLAIALTLIGLHAISLWWEARLLPTLAWDAWSTWLFKARIWFGQDGFLPFVEPAAAVRPGDAVALPALAPHYPNAVPRFAVWLASANGAWSGELVRGLWPALWLALGAVCAGGLRALGVSLAVASLAAAALLSLPLVNHHAALAGYADLWVATVALMAALRLAAWMRSARRSDALLFLIYVALLPAIKLEGGIWMAGLLGAAGVTSLAPRWQFRTVAGMVVLVTMLVLSTGIMLPLPGLGWLELRWGEVVVPGVGTLELYWRPVWREVLGALFLLPNWHLLWYAFPVVMLFGWRRLRLAADARVLGWFLLYALGFLAGLFFLTDASRWAENLTSVNRVLLQVVPIVVVIAALTFRADRVASDNSR